MRLTFFGSAREVGRSCIMLESKDRRELMLDCGVKMGSVTTYPLIPQKELHLIKHIALTHAHLDHSGYLPHLFHQKIKPHIYCTKPTHDLLGLLLTDYQRLQEEKQARETARAQRGGRGGRAQGNMQARPANFKARGGGQFSGRGNSPSGSRGHLEMGTANAHSRRTNNVAFGAHGARDTRRAGNVAFGLHGAGRHGSELILSAAEQAEMAGEERFTAKDVQELLAKNEMVEYNQEIKKPGMIPFTFYQAGHILGAAMVLAGGSKKVLYTGDINTRETRILDGAMPGLHADVLIMESTYGGKTDHIPALKTASNTLCESIKRTLHKGGSVLIPSFGIGRGQELMLTLETYMRSGLLPEVPVFIDGMVSRCTKVYRHNVIYARREIQLRILMSDDDPFKSPYFRVPEHKDRHEVYGQPCVIIAPSGMLNGGPVMDYLQKLAPERRNKLILVGYQAEGTRGKRLLDGAKEITLRSGETVDVNMEVELTSFSAHGDHADLVKFANSMKGLKKIFLVHGEEKKMPELAADLRRKDVEVIIPRNEETYFL